MVKNGFFHSHLLCTSSSAVIDESEQQEIISQKRSFDSNESSWSTKKQEQQQEPQRRQQQQRKYVSHSELNQGVEASSSLWNAPATAPTTTKKEVGKSYNVVDLDDEVSSDNSGSNRSDSKDDDDDKNDDGKVNVVERHDDGIYRVTYEPEGTSDIVSVVEPSKEALLVAWSHIAKRLEDEIAFGIVPVMTEVPAAPLVDDDERTQGSDNSKCSFGYEKPIMKKKSKMKKDKLKSSQSKKVSPPPSSSSAEHEEVLKSLYETEQQQPVLDKTPSKIGTELHLEEQLDNTTTCTWSESADSSIPTVIYIRRDIPPVVPDDEALGQNYTAQQLRAIYDYTNHMKDPTGKATPTTPTTSSSKGYLMKGLRFITLGAIGSKETPSNAATTTPLSLKMKKIHLDDDASEAFHQTLIDI